MAGHMIAGNEKVNVSIKSDTGLEVIVSAYILHVTIGSMLVS